VGRGGYFLLHAEESQAPSLSTAGASESWRLLFQPVKPTANLYEKLRIAARIAYAMFRQEHTSKCDIQGSIDISRTERLLEASASNGFADATDCVSFDHSKG
jgi:hypothetical protein